MFEFGRRAVIRGGLMAMTALLPRRFDRCDEAARALESRQLSLALHRRRDDQKQSLAGSCGDAVVSTPFDCGADLACDACAAVL